MRTRLRAFTAALVVAFAATTASACYTPDLPDPEPTATPTLGPPPQVPSGAVPVSYNEFTHAVVLRCEASGPKLEFYTLGANGAQPQEVHTDDNGNPQLRGSDNRPIVNFSRPSKSGPGKACVVNAVQNPNVGRLYVIGRSNSAPGKRWTVEQLVNYPDFSADEGKFQLCLVRGINDKIVKLPSDPATRNLTDLPKGLPRP